MKKIQFAVLICIVTLPAVAQQVPAKMDFAGMKLRINDAGRREIQKDVDALVASEKHFRAKLEKIEEYFPLVEQVFKEEGLPEDFKYLVIQESALIPDAVSTSNAVGFWQFKKETAQEVELRVDSKIDERMHIISASRGAAKYLQKNNYLFNNWLHALQAYQMGPTGAQQVLGDKHNGARSMTVSKNTYWYVRKYLAHKIAFQDAIDRYETSPKTLVEYSRSGGKTLKQIAKEVGVSEDLLIEYNKWVRGKRIPTEGNYVVLVPMENIKKADLLAFNRDNKPNPSFEQVQSKKYPIIEGGNTARPFLVTINGLSGILASEEDSPESLAEFGDMDVRKFRKYNDLNLLSKVNDDEVYYLQSKRGKAKMHYHTVQTGESLWQISQRYGIKLTSLLRKNGIDEGSSVKEGRILWLRKKRPASVPVEFREIANPKPIVAEVRKKKEAEKKIVLNVVEAEPEDDNSGDDGEETEENATIASDNEVQEFEEEFSELSKSATSDQATDGGETENLPKTEQEETAEVGFQLHKVKQGETLYSISKHYQVSIQELMAWNELQEPAVNIDQELKIKSRKIDAINTSGDLNKDESYIYHEVTKGDTLFNIAKHYGVSVDKLIQWNNKKDTDLQLGERLAIRK